MDEWIITTAIGLVTGIIGYFLKRTMSQVDRHETQIQLAASKEDLKEQTKEIQSDIRRIQEDYTPRDIHQKAFDECRKDIKDILKETRENYQTKDDFIREITAVNKKLDRMIEMMIEAAQKGGTA